MQLKKTAGTLDELMEQEQLIRADIKAQQKTLKTIVATRKQFQKLTDALPAEKPHRRSKKAKSQESAA